MESGDLRSILPEGGRGAPSIRGTYMCRWSDEEFIVLWESGFVRNAFVMTFLVVAGQGRLWVAMLQRARGNGVKSSFNTSRRDALCILQILKQAEKRQRFAYHGMRRAPGTGRKDKEAPKS